MLESLRNAQAVAQERLTTLASANAIRTPSLWFDEQAIRHNIAATIARVGDVRRWRPHIKTHKCEAIVRLCIEQGVRRFKCATLAELDCIAKSAQQSEALADVCFAYPLYQNQWRAAQEIERTLGRTTVSWLVDSPEHLRQLTQEAKSSQRFALDVDTGMRRSGSSAERWFGFLEREEFLAELKPHDIVALHGYEGHLSWQEQSKANQGYDLLLELRKRCLELGFDPEVVSSGSHSYAHALAHPGLVALAENATISPGTIVLNDLHSHRASEDLGLQFGAFVASRVISCSPGRMTLDAGSKAISPDVHKALAQIVGHPGWTTQAQHEEHLVMVGDPRAPGLEPGDIVWLIPAHVCTSVNLYDHANLFDAQGRVETVKVWRGHRWAEAHVE